MVRLATVLIALGLVVTGSLSASTGSARAEAPDLEFYMLDCGTIQVLRADLFSDTADYPPEPMKNAMPVPCFLIKHPDGVLLWDAGLPDSLKTDPEAGKSPFFLSVVDKTLVGALAELGLKITDVTHFAVSHLHFDHAGNANLFGHAKLVIQEAEYEAGFGKVLPLGFDPSLYSGLREAERVGARGDYDVFGDGSVVALFTPGHTPGHQCLLVNLKETGPIILSGDLFHLVANRTGRRVPSFNTDRADTLASMDRIERLAENLGARILVQHDPTDHDGIPMAPAFLK